MVQVKGINFSVEIQRKRIKNLIMRLKDTTLYISAPFYMPEYKIYQFIESRRDWIYKVYIQNQIKIENTYMYHGGDVFYVFGKQYHLIRQIGKKNVKIIDDKIYLTYKDDSEEAIKYLYKYMDKYIIEKAKLYYEKFKVMLDDYGYHLMPDIGTRIMKSKWGVCYVKKNKINVSSYLIHYPLDCLEYIMIHEMTHFIVPNHSKRFYEIVKKYMPLYKEANAKLKQ
ncbi:MAG: SprT family zinc-dependent metalloprotease [Erysipelotrichaceae bacterium]|nr:SprT family zinc-dependent metalloprotease [Erysipelotrichaceae bacterium]